ncbi:cytochrome bc1 complex Rieske iron-sulfur subunit [Demequina sediminicola]|uniref:cytochrome bc1 complex Rieske iron-sulfur subunit n=1 Tax=Demequina sediminicola TaxID=1095026 RepID=UPI0007839BB7|nr:Rieske 2Fe-2S domain-containing protein [Demequina sediminicola]
MSTPENTPDDAPQEGFVDPGLAHHRPRRADVDPKADKRAERQVAALFGLSAVGTVIALWAYFTKDTGDGGDVATIQSVNMWIGIGVFLAMSGIGFGAIHWAKTLMRDHEMVEERHEMRSSDENRAAAIQNLKDGAEDSGLAGGEGEGAKRRSVLKGSLITAMAIAPLAILVPQIGNMGGDWNVSKFRHTMWGPGVRLARDPDGALIKAADVTVGSAYHVIPEGLNDLDHHHKMDAKAKAVVLLVRLDPSDLKIVPGREDWSFDGIVAYSKICTHVGCPVALYEQQTHHLLCPCHQSTFDVSDGAKVVFGPAKRPLPQLPIAIDDEGYIVAKNDFDEPVGPSYWERLKGDSSGAEAEEESH